MIKEKLKECLEVTLGLAILNGICIYEPLMEKDKDWKEQLAQIKQNFYNIYEPVYNEIKDYFIR